MQHESDLVNWDLLRNTEVKQVPFPYMIARGFVRRSAMEPLARDFPTLTYPGGSFPLKSLRYGPAFSELVGALSSKTMADIVGRKLGMDLSVYPTMVTVRGWSRARDGQIHTDSTNKLVTALLYMNEAWESSGGRLRLLRSPDNLSDYAAEVPPDYGTLITFKNGPTAWHGFERFEGPRRVIQVNWVTGRGVARWEDARHRLSALLKRLRARPEEFADAPN